MLNRGSIYTLLCFIIMYSYVKRRLKQIYQNLIEDRYKEKAATTKKANIYFNHLVRAKRLKYMLTFVIVGAISTYRL